MWGLMMRKAIKTNNTSGVECFACKNIALMCSPHHSEFLMLKVVLLLHHIYVYPIITVHGKLSYLGFPLASASLPKVMPL